MSDYYILDDNKNVIPVDDVLEWGQWFETADRRIARFASGPLVISTVFLGLDHRYSGDGLLPVVFETMVFYGKKYNRLLKREIGQDVDCERCCTYEEALALHKRMIKKWRHKIPGAYGEPENPLL